MSADNRDIERVSASALERLQPQSFAEIERLGAYAAKSQLFGVKTTEQAVCALLTGASLGLSPVAALRGITVIQGKATLDATMIAGIVRAHPDCESWHIAESTDTRCTITTKRRGEEPTTLTWTLDDAKRAGLTGKDNWKNYPRAMLRARCTAELARMVYGDALYGVYTPDELEREPEPQRTVVTVVNNAPAPSAPVVAAPNTDACPAELRAQIVAARTTDELRAAWERASATTAKGTPERRAATALINARKAELERGPSDDPPPTGTDGPRAPSTDSATSEGARGDVVDAEFTARAESDVVRAWRERTLFHDTPQHVAASYAAHAHELGDDADACREITLARLATFRSVTDPGAYLLEAIVRHDANELRTRKAA